MLDYTNEIERVINYYLSAKNQVITKEQAFEILIIQYFFYKEKEISDVNGKVEEHLTNGTNDGGIDVVFYDDEDEILYLVQCKLSNVSSDEIIDEFRKMHTTVEAFRNSSTGAYSDKLKRILQENLDRLPDNGQIEYQLFYIGELNSSLFRRKLSNSFLSAMDDSISVLDVNSINSQIANIQDTTTKVSEFRAKIDRANNHLEYSSDMNEGIMVNISSQSIINMYNRFKDKGLFDMNIRKYISNKLVDNGINRTLDSDRENFWFYNNGLIIAAEEFDLDGDVLKLYQFSIVNGGQTTNLLGKYRGKNQQEFYIPCKVVYHRKKDEESTTKFFTQIAETTNSQKPIKASDLKSNAPEMITLRRDLENYKIDFQIKRGEKAKSNFVRIKNEEFGQIILSFVMQRPGTARSNKKSLFENNSIYSTVYKRNYTKNKELKEFIVDLIYFNDRYKRLIEELKKEKHIFHDSAMDILKNGTNIIFAIFGLFYRIQNNDIPSIKYALENTSTLSESHFVYGSFISNYKEDDLDYNIKEFIKEIVIIVDGRYRDLHRIGEVTSVSNYFKTDKKYVEVILDELGRKLISGNSLKIILQYSSFLKRKE